ncbi:MAG: hypothetical protein U5K99_04165 [Anaerolineales bacterium]|nr:hypothetical protein [Anaerolineales bacterium]
MMDNNGIRSGWMFLKPVLIIALGAALATGVVCWIIGWRTLSLYGTGLLIAGGAAVVVGALSTIGGWGSVRSFEYQFAKTAWEDDSGARLQNEVADTRESYRFLYLMSTTGLILISAGFLLDAVF